MSHMNKLYNNIMSGVYFLEREYIQIAINTHS